MNKKQIRLTESDLKQIVKEAVNKIISEAYGTPDLNTRTAIERVNNSKSGLNLPLGWPTPNTNQGMRQWDASDRYRNDLDKILNNARDIAYMINNMQKYYVDKRKEGLRSYRSSNIDNYLDAMKKYIAKLIKIGDMAYDKIIMLNGEQPT